MMVGSTPSSLFVHYASFYKVSPLGRMPPARSCPYIQSVSTISGVHPCLPTTIANAQRTWEDRMMTRLQFFLPPLSLKTGP